MIVSLSRYSPDSSSSSSSLLYFTSWPLANLPDNVHYNIRLRITEPYRPFVKTVRALCGTHGHDDRTMLIGIVAGTCDPGYAQHARTSTFVGHTRRFWVGIPSLLLYYTPLSSLRLRGRGPIMNNTNTIRLYNNEYKGDPVKVFHAGAAPGPRPGSTSKVQKKIAEGDRAHCPWYSPPLPGSGFRSARRSRPSGPPIAENSGRRRHSIVREDANPTTGGRLFCPASRSEYPNPCLVIRHAGTGHPWVAL